MKISVDNTKKYCLAVSGGVDSMVLLHLFATYSPKLKFYVLTVNHNLREEAQKDCAFVERVCKTYNVECVTESVDMQGYAKQNGVSLETAGRLLRKALFSKQDCDYVVTAHHKNDNVESILMHVLRGSGAKGASGMKKIDERFFRPLLDYSKDEIKRYAEENNVEYVTDSTNADNNYTRNYVRNCVMPLLSNVNENYLDNILRFSKSVDEDDIFLDSLADISQVTFQNGKAVVSKETLNRPMPVSYRLLKKVFASLGVSKDVEKAHYEAIVALAKTNGRKSVDLPFGFIAESDYETVTICKAKGQTKREEFCTEFSRRVETPFGVVTVTKGKSGLYFDMDKLPKDCVLRTRKQGDVFRKFGGGTKKLKDWLMDKKIPVAKRNELLVVAKDNDVYIVVGEEISDAIKVDKNSESIYNINIVLEDER